MLILALELGGVELFNNCDAKKNHIVSTRCNFKGASQLILPRGLVLIFRMGS